MDAMAMRSSFDAAACQRSVVTDAWSAACCNANAMNTAVAMGPGPNLYPWMAIAG
ncbi:hypothetical protein BLA29_007634 [Euroglyphus maynei]|uniref:Uncharacterized protein n=1 Tax=Euroglyphus maynei TaxID=6958 RepID=A0A1Y3BK65_EURMA|nr:hypothetical protein BLA29_007634 [Euroglyphus maynei]